MSVVNPEMLKQLEEATKIFNEMTAEEQAKAMTQVKCDFQELHASLPVAGYQPQPQSNIEAVNLNKRQEEALLRMLDVLAKEAGIDQRWLAIGRTHIEQGFMAINRAIFKPSRVAL